MNQLVDKVQELGGPLRERGRIFLFALAERDDSKGKWDLLFSSAWSSQNDRNAVEFIAKLLVPKLTPPELEALSRIIVLSPADPFVAVVHTLIGIENGKMEFYDNTYNGVPLRHMIIFTSIRP